MILEAAAEGLVEELAEATFRSIQGRWRSRRAVVMTTAHRIAADLMALRDVEFSALGEGDWNAAVLVVDEIVRAGHDLQFPAVVEAGADAAVLSDRLRRRGAPLVERAHLEPAAAVDTLLTELCHRAMHAVVEEDPRFVSPPSGAWRATARCAASSSRTAPACGSSDRWSTPGSSSSSWRAARRSSATWRGHPCGG